MKLESIHKKVLSYLQNHGRTNTYKLSRDLKTDRIEIIKRVEELKDENLVEFSSNMVMLPEIVISQEVLATKEKGEETDEAANIETKHKQEEQEIQKELALKILGDVSPSHCFYLCNGAILKNLDDMLNALQNIDDEVYEYHANNEKNDFCNWIKDIVGDTELAFNLKMKSKPEAINILKARIEYVKNHQSQTC